MGDERTNVMVCGLGWSGSSAVVDLLREYDGVGIYQGEFDHFRIPGLIGDLLSGAEDPRGRLLLFREWIRVLRTRRRKFFIRSLIPAQMFTRVFPGRVTSPRAASLRRIPYLVEEIRNLKRFLRVVRKEVDPGELLENARSCVRSMADLYAKDKDFVVLDQPIIQESHLDFWPDVFQPYKLIFIIRDPRDQMANAWKHRDFLFDDVPWKVESCVYGRDKESKRPLYYMAETALMRMKKSDEIKKVLPDENVLTIRFESLIQNYEETKSILESFLGVSPENHREKFSYFDPKKSEKNIGMYRTYLDDSDLQRISGLSDWYASESGISN